MPELQIRADWDEEAQVWVVTSDDVPGLVTEAPTKDEVIAKLRVMVPELLEANGLLNEVLEDGNHPEVPISVMSQQISKVRLRV